MVGLKLGVPLYLLVLHDWSKFTPAELPHLQRRFSDVDVDLLGVSYACNHHQNNNKHHREYWIPVTGLDNCEYGDLQPLPMPRKYALEMVAD